MQSSNPFHSHSLLPKSNRNVTSSMFIKSLFNPPPLRSSPIPILSILNRTPHLKIRASILRMADPQPNQPEQSHIKSNPNQDEKQEIETTPLPPPPEKPLPDDCCGSGCVRCVWDVYYDELEEYNKLKLQK